MGVRNMWKGFGGQSSDPVRVPDAEAAAATVATMLVSERERAQMLESFEAADIAWFWATDAENRLSYLSPKALSQFPADSHVLGNPLSKILKTACDDGQDTETKPMSFLLSAKSSFMEQIVCFADGVASQEDRRWWQLTGRPQFDRNRNFLGYRGMAKDITDVYEEQRRSSRMAEYDALTGLANRHRMGKRLGATLTAYKVEKRSCALVMLDLDRFKQVNDTLGHPAGDELLRQVSQRLQTIVPQNAEIGRLGGDEFQLIIPDMDDRGNLGEIANRIIQMISQPYSIEGSRAIIGTSVGIAIAPYDGVEPDELVKSADLALYAAKGGGRGQFRFYSDDLQNAANDRREIEEDLRDAIAAETLEMHYQPQVDTQTHQVKGFEALMRWEHPEHGFISPGVFIPIAEDSSLIDDLGTWALRQSCKDAAAWPGELPVSVNVSARQFLNEELPEVVEKALKDSGLAPSRLELEITESVFMGDMSMTETMFASLKKLGVKLSLDDFGTGFSSMSYLSKAPFDKIKIDQSFVRGCAGEAKSNLAIVVAIAGLARALDMTIVAEGVEAMDELEIICRQDIDLVQGFIFSRAIPQDQIMAKLDSGEMQYEPVGPAVQRAERRTLFRRIGVVHEDHHYTAMLRDLSRSGARIEGLLDVPVGTGLVLDLGGGQLVVATVKRSQDATQGVEFEVPLVSDGAGGLCTRHRVSPYMLAAAGMPLKALGGGHHLEAIASGAPQSSSRPRFMQVDIGPTSARAG
ncbi:EAL domain-containing protein [Aurantiacibacter gangjinensis]|uniref:Diguanylate phosphodiesterase n=1 Tax=Aurantiacibacter gangjinensis TaxID=502682 RepID=A0A0G9MQ68_9SPHN|nr:EAL domain-containing protein [Aurantiacibacter gangjinensis]APE28506.1 diguanylate cyclase/phosphodiesterase (GGDEF & EAL domains) with PAS/PAC sensor(s) [Aurantiacibacter gangjinensis]KLE32709.1 diguanylate phosphodiesterase [Aurantiacibacter gangjinensis]